MFHPLLESPANLKDSELENRILDLTKKWHIAARFGNGAVCDQLIVILETLKSEQYQRSQKMLKTAVSKQSGNLDNLINVN